MATLTALGVGSGLDINGIVSSLMAVERQPLNELSDRKKDYQAQLSAVGRLKSALSTFQSAMDGLGSFDKFKVFSASSANESVFTASASAAAAPGVYSIVVTQIAQAHKMASGLTGIANESTSIGATGTLRISVGANSFSVVVDGTNNTLAGIRDAINGASANTGVTATVLNVSNGTGGTESRLVLTSNNTGTANQLSVSDVSGNVAAVLNMATITGKDARDAVLTVDNFNVTSGSNNVTGVIQGVTLNLVAAGTSTLTIAHDTAAVKVSVEEFVSTYNSLRATISDLKAGDLKGDNTLLSVQSLLRNELNTEPTGLTTTLTTLSEIGIKTERNGDLSLNASELEAALANDYDGVAQLMADDNQGYAFRLEALADEMLKIDGLIDSRTKGINARVDTLDGRIDNMEYRLTLIEARYRSQFTALDAMLTQMQSTSNYLSQQLPSLPGAS